VQKFCSLSPKSCHQRLCAPPEIGTNCLHSWPLTVLSANKHCFMLRFFWRLGVMKMAHLDGLLGRARSKSNPEAKSTQIEKKIQCWLHDPKKSTEVPPGGRMCSVFWRFFYLKKVRSIFDCHPPDPMTIVFVANQPFFVSSWEEYLRKIYWVE